MKWLNDYVKADMPIKEFCDGMTMSGSKVETWTKQGADITNVVVGKCVAMEKRTACGYASLRLARKLRYRS